MEQVAGHRADVQGNRALLDRRIFGCVRPPVNPVFLVKAVGVARGGAGELVLVVLNIHHHAVAELLQVVHAEGLSALGFGLGERRQKKTGKNGDDRDDHQQFDQSEADAMPAVQ